MTTMKIKHINLFLSSCLIGLTLSMSSCVKDLLDQVPTGEMASSEFWKTEADAMTALNGAYNEARKAFAYDYYWDGHGEFQRTVGVSFGTAGAVAYASAGAFRPAGGGGSFDTYYRTLYALVNRANYVIDNVLENSIPNANEPAIEGLERVVGEARMLRAMAYFRLIQLWGDVPYFDHVISDNEEVTGLGRLPIAQIRDYILEDLNYAFDKLPAKADEIGRASKPATLALRGKVNLYWASWNNFGWPELKGFSPSSAEANAAYIAAAEDFKSVINDYGLTLFRNGEPGEWGEMGESDVLPNYFYLFMPEANGDSEMILYMTFGGTGTGQSEELLRDFGTRSTEAGQNRVNPHMRIVDRYQSTITGDFVEPVIPLNPNTVADARTRENSAVNPETYRNRDYRMKASVLWDYETLTKLENLQEKGPIPFIYGRSSNVTEINADANRSGILFRKYVRNYAGQLRNEGDYNFPLIRLADVFLMYAEASNFAYGPQGDAIELVNKVRHRGNLPPLSAEKTASQEAFFKAIEQERIVELFAEGHRGFDIRRWRKIEEIWGSPNGDGLPNLDTWGVLRWGEDFKQADARTYEQAYIFRIPLSEIERNPNIVQNEPWL